MPEIPHGLTDAQYNKLVKKEYAEFLASLTNVSEAPPPAELEDEMPQPVAAEAPPAIEDEDAEGGEGIPSTPLPFDASDEEIVQGLAENEELDLEAELAFESIQYGIFRITARPAHTSGGGPFGGWQGSCPFHKLNERTGCKRFFGFRDDSLAERELKLRLCKWWCLEGPPCTRQRHHLYMPMNIDDTPSMEFLDACALEDEDRPDEVQTDAQLDALDGLLPHTHRGRGRGRGRRGRGKGSGRGRAASSSAAVSEVASLPGGSEYEEGPPESPRDEKGPTESEEDPSPRDEKGPTESEPDSSDNDDSSSSSDSSS